MQPKVAVFPDPALKFTAAFCVTPGIVPPTMLQA
jgi:hypothetical protein